MIRLLDRHWLLTSTTYGTWLPGECRGFDSPVRDDDQALVLHNVPGTPDDTDMPALAEHAREKLRGPPIRFHRLQADRLIEQFLETSAHRNWLVIAASVMTTHVHIVVTVPGDPAPKTLLQSFKSYGSRVLNERWGQPASGTWWTESGSKRKLPNENSVRAATRYVYHQPGYLARYIHPEVPLDWYTNGERGT